MDNEIFKVIDFIDERNQPCAKKDATMVVCQNKKNKTISLHINRFPKNVDKNVEYLLKVSVHTITDNPITTSDEVEK